MAGKQLSLIILVDNVVTFAPWGKNTGYRIKLTAFRSLEVTVAV